MSTKFMTGLTLAALAALGLAAAHPAAAQTLISNGFTQSTSNNQSSPYNLTTIGTTDWINYGNYNSNAVNQKGTSTTIVGLISTAAAFHAPGSGATGRLTKVPMITLYMLNGVMALPCLAEGLRRVVKMPIGRFPSLAMASRTRSCYRRTRRTL